MSDENEGEVAKGVGKTVATLVAENALHSLGINQPEAEQIIESVGETAKQVIDVANALHNAHIDKLIEDNPNSEQATHENQVFEENENEQSEMWKQHKEAKVEAQSRADDENLKGGGGNRAEADQAQAEALQSKQLEEMKGLKDDLEHQQQAAQKELENLGLDAKGKEEFCNNEFNESVQKMNEMITAHDQERADLKGDNESIPADIQAQRSQMSGDLCHAEAERQVTAENDARVQSYGEKRTPEPALLQSYQEFLNTTAPQEIAARTETLQEVNFPQVSREGPSTSMNGPEGNSPSSPGGSSGPDSGPD